MKHLFASIVLIFTFALLPGRVFADPDRGAEAGQLQAHRIQQDTRVDHLRAYLASYDSPLAVSADTFVAEADKHNLDWKLVAAIAGTESTFGKHIPRGSYNAWGWGIPTGAQSGLGFTDWEQGIATVSEGLAKNYFGRGAKTLYDVGWIYAANGISWGNHTRFFIEQIVAFKPETPELLPVSI